MRRNQLFFTAALLGMFFVGPLVNYAFAIVRFGAGLVSSFELTVMAGVTLFLGTVVGLISATLCAVSRYRPWLSTFLSGAVMSFLWASLFMVQMRSNGVFQGWAYLLYKLMPFTLSAALTGYLIATLTKVVERRSRQNHVALSPNSVSSSETKTYTIN